MQRFKQEAHAAASLNHPNIAHIYEIGESEGSHFIAMEYIDGPTLREAICAEQAKVYDAQGKHEQALDERLKGAPPETAIQMKRIFAASGINGYWKYRLEQTLERAKREYVSPADIALYYARLNERDQAFIWLGKAMEERSILFNYLVADARFDNLRSDPRYAELLGRVGLKPLRQN